MLVLNIDNILPQVAHGRIFAKINLSDAFFKTLMHELDIEKMATTTELGLFEGVMMLQGACSSPATQQCHLNEALHGLIGEVYEVYVDDIIVWAKDADELNSHLEASEFFCNKVKFLGHMISANCICPDPVKVCTIQEQPQPQSPRDLQSFLGLLQYLQKFIPAIAQHTHPLTALLPPCVATEKAWIAHQCVLSQGQHPKAALPWVWRWMTEASASFETLKQKVTEIGRL
ncbi:hypothetical protein D1P53_005610 [Cryptococcus gattii VGV]|nr:hypothetical protein D1P53_005610 [Cryptococcus gattii VGV]